ncbi:MAG: hypothetical protein H6700_10350 [Myxococcales bacterium]|nr:hypothetical protein [Myxococcales bacterium]
MTSATFAICQFGRVFDTQPKQEVVPLPDLVTALTRFELKLTLGRRLRRDVDRVERAAEQALRASRGEPIEGAGAGAWLGDLLATVRDAPAGSDVGAAVRMRADGLIADVRRGAKRDLRLWSPALYRAGAARGSDGVEHVSCLVLDYDDTPLDEIDATWASWFRIIHTTWSHTPTSPRFRAVLPLSEPVLAEDWPTVWRWAAELSRGRIDAALSGCAAAFALPATADAALPRFAAHFGGPLLDVRVEGLGVRTGFAPSPSAFSPDELLRDGAPGHSYLVGEAGATSPPTDPWETFSGGTSAGSPPSGDTTAREHRGGSQPAIHPRDDAKGAPRVDAMDATLRIELAALTARVEALERGRDIVGALTRLAALRDAGDVDDVEFALAKAAVLAGD